MCPEHDPPAARVVDVLPVLHEGASNGWSTIGYMHKWPKKKLQTPSRRRGNCAGKWAVHPRNQWVQGLNLTGGSQPAKLPSFGGYSLETITHNPNGASEMAARVEHNRVHAQMAHLKWPHGWSTIGHMHKWRI